MRTPVAMVIAPNDATWQGVLLVLCDDGTLWNADNRGWVEYHMPIPGSRAAEAEASRLRLSGLQAEPTNEEWIARNGAADQHIAALESALKQAADWFDEYAMVHSAKDDEPKMRRNQERADFCREALGSA